MDARLEFKLGQTPMKKISVRYILSCVWYRDMFATEKPKIDCDVVHTEAYAIAKFAKNIKLNFYVTNIPILLMKMTIDWEQNVAQGCKQFKEQVLDKLSNPR